MKIYIPCNFSTSIGSANIPKQKFGNEVVAGLRIDTLIKPFIRTQDGGQGLDLAWNGWKMLETGSFCEPLTSLSWILFVGIVKCINEDTLPYNDQFYYIISSLSYHFFNNSQWSFHCYPPLLHCFFINVFPICSNHFNLPAFHVSHVFFIYQYLAIFWMFLSYPTCPATIFFQLSDHSPIPYVSQFPNHFWPFIQRFPHLFPNNPNCQPFFSAFFPTCSWHFIIVFSIFPPFCPACFPISPRVFPHVHPILSAFSNHFPTIFLPFPIPPVASRCRRCATSWPPAPRPGWRAPSARRWARCSSPSRRARRTWREAEKVGYWDKIM